MYVLLALSFLLFLRNLVNLILHYHVRVVVTIPLILIVIVWVLGRDGVANSLFISHVDSFEGREEVIH